jgi:hypothetical protein
MGRDEEPMPTTARYAMWGSEGPALRGVARLAGAVAWTAAAVTGAVLALFFAATMVVISLMGLAVLALAGAGARARGSVRRSDNPNLIEARHIGGHSWVAYGWDGRR